MSKEINKIPPQVIEIEKAVLGAAILEKSGTIAVLSQITDIEMFYTEKNQMVFKAIQALDQNRTKIDMLTVIAELKNQGNLDAIGGPGYIVDLTNLVSSSTHIQSHIMIVIEKYIRRKLIEITFKLHGECYDDTSDTTEILERSQLEILKILGKLAIKEGRTIRELMPEVLNNLRLAKENTNGILGIPSGIKPLDNVLSGFRDTFLYVIGARPGMGKTAFMIELLRSFLYQKVTVGVFSLEMQDEELVIRLIVRDLNVNSEALTNRDGLSSDQIKDRASNLFSDAVIIDDSSALTIGSLRSKAVALKAKHGIKILFVDYLQLAKGYENKKGPTNREQEISQISQGLKSIAKDLCIPVIVLAQLSREVDKRQDKRPQLSDLRESGSIEQDADVVMFLYRPEYYGIEEEQDANGETYYTKDKCELIIRKHRGGRTGEMVLNCDIAKNKFWSDEQPESFSNSKLKNLEFGFDETTGDVF